jgi:hypothetical protein
MNGISIYRGNSKSLVVDIPSTVSLSGFTAVLIVSTTEDFNSILFSVTGSTITGSTLATQSTTFNITKSQNDLEERVYFYQVYIDNEITQKFTVLADSYSILPS